MMSSVSSTLFEGTTTTLTCQTDLNVTLIEWLDSDMMHLLRKWFQLSPPLASLKLVSTPAGSPTQLGRGRVRQLPSLTLPLLLCCCCWCYCHTCSDGLHSHTGGLRISLDNKFLTYEIKPSVLVAYAIALTYSSAVLCSEKSTSTIQSISIIIIMNYDDYPHIPFFL